MIDKKNNFIVQKNLLQKPISHLFIQKTKSNFKSYLNISSSDQKETKFKSFAG